MLYLEMFGLLVGAVVAIVIVLVVLAKLCMALAKLSTWRGSRFIGALAYLAVTTQLTVTVYQHLADSVVRDSDGYIIAHRFDWIAAAVSPFMALGLSFLVAVAFAGLIFIGNTLRERRIVQPANTPVAVTPPIQFSWAGGQLATN